jgi:hypothetical protein
VFVREDVSLSFDFSEARIERLSTAVAARAHLIGRHNLDIGVEFAGVKDPIRDAGWRELTLPYEWSLTISVP